MTTVWDFGAVHRQLAVRRAAAPEGAWLRPVLSEAVVCEFEVRHGVTLPADYRDFLLRVGDGGPGPGFGLHPLSHSARELDLLGDGYLATPFRHTASWNPANYNPAFMELPVGGALTEDEYLGDRWTTGSLVVADAGCGYVCRLVVTGPARGQVWWDNRPSDGGIVPDSDFRTWYETWLHAPI